jgi:hypothetical protein
VSRRDRADAKSRGDRRSQEAIPGDRWSVKIRQQERPAQRLKVHHTEVHARQPGRGKMGGRGGVCEL